MNTAAAYHREENVVYANFGLVPRQEEPAPNPKLSPVEQEADEIRKLGNISLNAVFSLRRLGKK